MSEAVLRGRAASGPQHRRIEATGSTTRNVVVVFIALMLAILLFAMDQTIVATALPTIVGSLHGVSEMAWVTTVYLLTSTAVLPIYGKLGDLVGRKGLFVFSIVVFLIGSILSGLSQNMSELIAFRGLQGVGGGGLMIGAQAIIGDIVPPRERGKYMGFFGAVFGVATVAGPLLGGALTEYASWRWIFYVNVPIGAVALPIVVWALKLPRNTARPRLDIPGMVLLAAASVCITLFATWGGSTYPWSSPVTIGLAAGFVLLAAFFVLAEHRAAEPIFPLRLFRGSIFNLSSLIGVLVGVALFGAVAYLGYFLQMVDHVTATVSGLLMLPFVGGMLVSSIASGQIVTRTGRYKVFPIVGMAIAAGGMYLLSLMSTTSTRVENGIYMAVLGFGIGLVMQILVLVVQNAAPVRDLGAATAATNYIRQIGGTIGSGIVGSLFASRLINRLHRLLPAGAVTHVQGGQTLTPQMLRSMPAPIARVITEAYAQALPPIFRYLVPLLVVGFVLAFFLKEKRLRTTVGMVADAAVDTAAVDVVADPSSRVVSDGRRPALALAGARGGAAVAGTVGGWTGNSASPGGGNGRPAGADGHAEAVPPSDAESSVGYLGAPPAAGDGGSVVHGRVRQADDGSIPDATVTVIDLNGRQAGRDRTGPDGSYRIPVPGQSTYTVIAMAPARRPHASAVYVPDGPVEVDLVLAGASRLTGTVRVAGGDEPLAGAIVTLANTEGEVVAARGTDAAGRYLFDDVTPGRYTLAVSAPSCQPVAMPVTVADGAQTTQDVELRVGGRLVGTAVSGRGTAVPDARVTLLDAEGNVAAVTTTGEDGRYAVENLPEGEYTVIATGYPPVASRITITSSRTHSHDVRLGYPEA